MQSLGVLALLLAAAVAKSIDVAPEASDKITYKCSLEETHNIIVKEVKTPIYLCVGEQGAKFLLASGAASEPTLDAVLDKDAHLKVLDVFGNKRQKRQLFGGGFGGAGSHASSTAFGGGGGLGSPFGGGGFGGGFSGAHSSAGAHGGGGGFSPFG